MADIKWPRSFRKATELPADEVAVIVEQLIAVLDERDGDPDIELSGDEQDVGWPERPGMGNPPFTAPVDSEDCEPGGDEKDIAWTEWQTRRRRKLTGGGFEQASLHEDDEEDDPSGQCDEDGINTAFDAIPYTVGAWGPGCPISDPDAEHDGSEREQMAHDVPCIPVFTLKPNIFNGQRQLLGYTLPKPLPNGTVEPEL